MTNPQQIASAELAQKLAPAEVARRIDGQPPLRMRPGGPMRVARRPGDHHFEELCSEVRKLQDIVREGGQEAPSASDALRGEIDGLARELSAVRSSVEFTEAYLSIEITKKMQEALADNAAWARSLMARTHRLRSRNRVLTGMVLLLTLLLAGEAHFDFLEPLIRTGWDTVQVKGGELVAWASGLLPDWSLPDPAGWRLR